MKLLKVNIRSMRQIGWSIKLQNITELQRQVG
jgi:hypothetical protein